MHKHTTMTTGRASLCALGEYLRRHCFCAPLREHVQIRQKRSAIVRSTNCSMP